MEKLRIVRGLIAIDGGVFSGSGFTSAKLGTGLYEITFTEAFGAAYFSVTVSPWGVGSAVFATQETIGTNKVQFQVYNSTGAATDWPTSFIATGPR